MMGLVFSVSVGMGKYQRVNLNTALESPLSLLRLPLYRDFGPHWGPEGCAGQFVCLPCLRPALLCSTAVLQGVCRGAGGCSFSVLCAYAALCKHAPSERE